MPSGSSSIFLRIKDLDGLTQLETSKSLVPGSNVALLHLETGEAVASSTLQRIPESPLHFAIQPRATLHPALTIRLDATSFGTAPLSMEFIHAGQGYRWTVSPKQDAFELQRVLSPTHTVAVARYEVSPRHFDIKTQAQLVILATAPTEGVTAGISEEALMQSVAALEFLYLEYAFVPATLTLRDINSQEPGSYDLELPSGYPLYLVANAVGYWLPRVGCPWLHHLQVSPG